MFIFIWVKEKKNWVSRSLEDEVKDKIQKYKSMLCIPEHDFKSKCLVFWKSSCLGGF